MKNYVDYLCDHIVEAIFLVLIVFLAAFPADAKRRRHWRQAPQTATEPKLTPCALARRANPQQVISAELEERIKLGLEPRRPTNVDPCP